MAFNLYHLRGLSDMKNHVVLADSGESSDGLHKFTNDEFNWFIVQICLWVCFAQCMCCFCCICMNQCKESRVKKSVAKKLIEEEEKYQKSLVEKKDEEKGE